MSNYFGKFLKEIRNEAGLSREELCRKTRIPFGSLSSYEQGTRKPKADVVVQLALGFDDVDLDMVFSAYFADMTEALIDDYVQKGKPLNGREFCELEEAFSKYSMECFEARARWMSSRANKNAEAAAEAESPERTEIQGAPDTVPGAADATILEGCC